MNSNDPNRLNPRWRNLPARSGVYLPGHVGIRFPDGHRLMLFESGARVPVEVTKVFTTTQDNQTNLAFHLVQYSDAESPTLDRELGRFVVTGIAGAKKGEPQVELMLRIDELGNLRVTSRDRLLNIPMELKILYNKNETLPGGVRSPHVSRTFYEIIIARIGLRSA